jgi:anti-anti-sigma regulatory factor
LHVALTDAPKVVLVDARECGVIDEHGVAALMAVNKLSRRVGVQLQLVPSPAIARRFDALWLTSHFSFAKA